MPFNRLSELYNAAGPGGAAVVAEAAEAAAGTAALLEAAPVMVAAAGAVAAERTAEKLGELSLDAVEYLGTRVAATSHELVKKLTSGGKQFVDYNIKKHVSERALVDQTIKNLEHRRLLELQMARRPEKFGQKLKVSRKAGLQAKGKSAVIPMLSKGAARGKRAGNNAQMAVPGYTHHTKHHAKLVAALNAALHGREHSDRVNVSMISQVFGSEEYSRGFVSMNPANKATFPRVGNIARNWTSWRGACVLMYVPYLTDLERGSIMLSMERNPIHDLPYTRMEQSQHDIVHPFKANEYGYITLFNTYDDEHGPFEGWYYTRPSTIANDLQLYDPGVGYFSVTGTDPSLEGKPIGELWVASMIDFKDSKPGDPLSAGFHDTSIAGTIWGTTLTQQIAPWSDGTFLRLNSSNEIDDDGTYLWIGLSGTFHVTIRWTWSVAPTDISAITTVGNCTVFSWQRSIGGGGVSGLLVAIIHVGPKGGFKPTFTGSATLTDVSVMVSECSSNAQIDLI